MKASELRVGNYYTTGIEVKGSREAKLNLMDDRTVKLTLDHLLVLSGIPDWLCAIHPIPITEEWLIKFGFEKTSCDYKIGCGILESLDKVWLHYDFKDKTCACGYDYECSGPGTKYHYVHQLQNLYFALTGEELTLK